MKHFLSFFIKISKLNQDGILVSASVPYINISGSAEVTGFSVSGSNTGVTIVVQGVGFPFSGSAVITGSLIISGSSQPIILQTLPVQPGPYVVTYDPTTGVVGYVNSTSGTSSVSGTNGTAGVSGQSASSGTNGSSGTSGTSGAAGQSNSAASSGTSGTSGTNGTAMNVRAIRESQASKIIWEKVADGVLYYNVGTNSGATAGSVIPSKIKMDVSTGDMFLSDGTKKVYHEGNLSASRPTHVV